MTVRQAEVFNLGDEHRIRFTPVAVGKGRAMFTRIAKIVGPALGAALKGADGASVEEMKTGALGEAIQVFFREVDDTTLEAMADLFSANTELEMGDDKWVPLNSQRDLIFRGRYDLYFKWLWHCLEVNYGSFFVGFQGLGRGALSGLLKKQSQSTSPSMSTEKSGE